MYLVNVVLISNIFEILVAAAAVHSASVLDIRGPSFEYEPPSKVEFDNSTGTIIRCSAKGTPTPDIWWETKDGNIVHENPGVQYFRPDGSMVFAPFSPLQYRRDIHDATYRCIAKNAAGKLGSRDVRIRAVLQDYKVMAYDAEFVIEGNVALLRCEVSGSGKEYVFVTSWLRDDGLSISLTDNLGKYTVLPSGHLQVRHVDELDASRKYRCQVHNKLSRETRLSEQWARIIMTEPHGFVPPRIVHWLRDIHSYEGETIWLPCVAHGYPVPTTKWYREQGGHIPFASGHRVTESDSILVIHGVTIQDSGKYVCIVNNSKGHEPVETNVMVKGRLHAVVTPPHKVATVGSSLALRCEVTGSPVHYLEWKKNMKAVSFDGRLRQQTNNVLEITSLKMGDEGIYQCFVYNSEESAQGSSVILIQADPPEIVSKFEDQTVKPGRPVSLRCIAKGHPLPKITWSTEGESLPISNRLRLGDFVTQDGGVVHSFLNISSVEVGDGRTYACTAESDFGTVGHVGKLNVPSPPVGRNPHNKTALVGTTTTFQCPVAGYPLTSFAWEKDSETLPNSHRHEILPNGKLVIHYVEKYTDDGSYWCTAGNTRGSTAKGRINVHVVAGPVIDHFSFPENLREGRRTSLSCTVSSGDPPVTFKWLKDGTTIDPSVLDVSLELFNEFSSIIFFKSAGKQHNGNYTCIASNLYASTNYTAGMVINIPPRWVIEPQDLEVVQGSSIRADCQAEGYPRPLIRWKQLIGSQGSPEAFQTIMSSARMQVLENGSLLILEAEQADGGSFLCQAFNGIGPGLSKRLTITVHVPAHFKTKFSAKKVKKGDQVTINCKAQGDTPISITWYKDGEVLNNSTVPRYSRRQYNHPDGLTSQLSVHSARRDDSSVFSCRASNKFGHDDSTVELVVQESPDHPTQVEVIHIYSRSIHVRWTRPFNGNSPITRFLVMTEAFKGQSSKTEVLTTEVSGSQTDATVRNLNPRTAYNVRVVAENAIGRSQLSKVITVTTDDEVPRSPPRQVRSNPLSSNSLGVSWLPPEGSQDGSITGYYIGYKALKSTEPYLYKTLEVKENFKTDILLTNLQSSTDYIIVVQAFNEKGPGPQSDEVTAQTLKFDPPTIPKVEVVKKTIGSIQIQWEVRSPVEGFLAYIKGKNEDWKEATLPQDTSTYTFDNLRCGSDYEIYLAPFTKEGKGPRSDTLQIKTEGNVPVPPARDSFLQVNTTSAMVLLSTWEDGGCPITQYNLRYRAHHEQTWTEMPMSSLRPRAFITGLNPGHWYKLVVGSRNSAGNKEVEFDFLTRRMDIGLGPPAPPIVAESSAMELQRKVAVITSAVCSAVVLVVIVIAACAVLSRRRRQRPEGQDPGADRRSMGELQKSSETVALSAWEKRPRPDSASHRGSQCRESLYLPCPYATARLSHFSVDGDTDGTVSHSVTIPANEHSYDVPIQVVSKLR